jgi:hypothetical protein
VVWPFLELDEASGEQGIEPLMASWNRFFGLETFGHQSI